MWISLLLNWRTWVGILLVAAGFWFVEWHQTRVHEAFNKGYATAQEQDRLAAVALTAKFTKEKEDALKDANLRYVAALDAATRLQRVVDSLRVQLSDTEKRIATASDSAVREYALAADQVFGECVERYRAMAVAAQGHADDVATLIAAWPKK